MQEIFNTVANHLIKQGHQASDDEACLYLDPETNFRCAVGCLIPPEDYKPEMEGKLPISLRSRSGTPLFSDSTLPLLNMLQKVHDNHSHYHLEDMGLTEQEARELSHDLVDCTRHFSIPTLKRALNLVAKHFKLEPIQ